MTTTQLKLYNVREVCDMLGISRTTLHRLTARGELHQVKLGRAVRYPHAVIEAYLAGTPYRPDEAPADSRDDLSTWPPTPSLLHEDGRP